MDAFKMYILSILLAFFTRKFCCVLLLLILPLKEYHKEETKPLAFFPVMIIIIIVFSCGIFRNLSFWDLVKKFRKINICLKNFSKLILSS